MKEHQYYSTAVMPGLTKLHLTVAQGEPPAPARAALQMLETNAGYGLS